MINPPTNKTGHAKPLSSTGAEVVVSKIANMATFCRLRRDSCGLVNENFDANAMTVVLTLQRTKVGDGLAGTGVDAFECPQNRNEVPVAFLRKIAN
ncbi:MAG: hypothetical protein ACI8RE_002567 [Ilumatobacter sp.]|jgi:hypothetical protein